ncbi:MAG: aminopeptidase, partial [Sphaerochaetaceae bacterium]
MADAREKKLAQLLVNYSVKLQKGESCLINAIDLPLSMVEELIGAVYAAGGYPLVNYSSISIDRALIKDASKESLALWADCDAYRMDKVDAFIGIRGIVNPRELATLGEANRNYALYYDTPVHHDIRIVKTRWVVTRYPTPLMAYQGGMSLKEMEDFFYSVTVGV